MSVAVSVRGQTVIPSDIRRRYNIKPNSRVEFVDTGTEIVLVPIPAQSFKRSRGILKGVSSKDLLAARRKERHMEHARR
jgi:AbrB family looped-hinge helix DNA binding protein